MSKKRLAELKELLKKYDFQYHTLDQPTISDYEYDQLYAELIQIERQHPEWIREDSPSQRVGSPPLEMIEKIPHRKPMLSLQNSYSIDDIRDFEQRLKKILKTAEPLSYLCEPKLDGLAMELIYEDGQLTKALTRGDGMVGENVWSNVKTIRNLPLKLKGAPSIFEVRGEILIFKDAFLKLNGAQQDVGALPFANPRNAAAGTIRQLDPKVAAQRPLRIFCYAPGQISGRQFQSQSEFLQTLKEFGLPTLLDICHQGISLIQKCTGADEVIDYYHSIERIRHGLPFEIDGIVIKINSYPLQTELGFVARSPRWATAAKFKPEEAETTITDIIVQVGRTGALTPVAIMNPVQVGGVTITHATLHNLDDIHRKDVRKGDRVVVRRAGDVIPEVVNVKLDQRPASSQPFNMPKKCPSCGETVVQIPDDVVLRCLNAVCPARIKESLKHFVSRRAMNIEKLGDKIIDQLFAAGLITQFSDIYRLKINDLLSLERQGERSANNIYQSIQKSRHVSLARFIYALGIRFVGEQTSTALAQTYKTIENFVDATAESLTDVEDIGPKTAEVIFQTLQQKKFRKEIQSLQKNGVKIEKPKTIIHGLLFEKTFVITGTLPVERDTVKDLILSYGGKVASSVSKNTDFIIAGDQAGSKLEKAQKLGTKILNWAEFQGLIHNQG